MIDGTSAVNEKENMVLCLGKEGAVAGSVGKDRSSPKPMLERMRLAYTFQPAEFSTCQPCDPAPQYSEIQAPHEQAQHAIRI